MRKTSFFSFLAAFALVLGGVGYADSANAQTDGSETRGSVYLVAGLAAAAVIAGIIAVSSDDDDDDVPVSA